MRFLKKNYGLFFILILSFWAVKPFFIPGFFPMHDDTQVARVFEMGKMLGSGVFPVRWVPDLGYGYGYPLFNFYAPLAYYIGGAFILLGFNALVATKIMMGLGVILAGVFMYFLARKFFGELGGIISGLFYLYAPYHAVDIYVRGDVAEFWAYAFIPLLALGVYKKNVLIGAVGYAGIILSHNLTALMVTPFLFIVVLLNCYIAFKNKKSFIINPSSLVLLLGLALSAFYWIPALVEIRNTNVFSQIGGGADFKDHFVCLGQLWDSLWGFGGSVPGCTDGLSFKIGKLYIVLSLLALSVTTFVRRIRENKERRIVFISFLGFFISVFFTLEISKPVWQAIPAMAFFQYPWRFLILTSFFSSVLAGSVVTLLGQYKIKPYLIVLTLVFFLLFFNIKLFNPQTILHKTAVDYTNEHTLKWDTSRISDEYLSPNFKKPKSEKEVAKGQTNIRVEETNIEKISNMVSLIGLLAMALGIILFKSKANYE